MNGPDISVAAGGNIYIRRMSFPTAGTVVKGHAHPYDHLTYLERGKLRVEISGREIVYDAPMAIPIVAHEHHVLTSMIDDTVAFCIHALRDKNSEEILEFNAVPFKENPLRQAAQLTTP